MAGIYIHIPFCRSACSYCNFHFSVSRRNLHAFVDALLKEIEIKRDFFDELAGKKQKVAINTVYFGGGTPSILKISDLMRILNKLNECFGIGHASEITLEANPDDLTSDYLSSLKASPINRLSIGIQSFHEQDLRYMNRLHTPAQARECLHLAKNMGFEKLSVDLIYGTPGMTDEMWEENLHTVIDMKIPHVSAYALTVEQKTPLEFMIRKGKAAAVSEEQTARQFAIMLDIMRTNGYLHYEISNFALGNQYSVHNLSYWQSVPYLGLGPSAHSYKQNRRSWNISNTSKYIESLNEDQLPQHGETLTELQVLDEYVMTSLRTMWGCKLQVIADKWGSQIAASIKKAANKYIRQGLLMEENGSLALTDKGKLFADGIASDLFVDKL